MKTKIFLSIFGLFAFVSLSAQQIGTGRASEINFSNSFNTQLLSGGYTTGNPQDGYPDSSPYKYLFTVRMPNDDGGTHNNCQFQISATTKNDDRMFFRKQLNKTTPQQWHEVATRGQNTFIGNQKIKNGSLTFTGNDVNGFSINFIQTSTTTGDTYFDLTKGPIWIMGKGNGQPIYAFGNNGKLTIGAFSNNGELVVNGPITAKEITVTTNGADFVFAKNYKLPTLTEVKAHIDEHQHLPDVPSAAEMQKNGLNISELSTKLLQKVEELTLYAIEQKETIEEQNKRIEQLELLLNSKK